MVTERKKLLYWIWLSLATGIGCRAVKELFDRFGDPESVYSASAEELDRVSGLSRASRRALSEKKLEKAANVLDLCEQHQISLLTYTEEAYPDLLRTVEAPPVLLYYRGNLPDLNRKLCIGMVGTRKMSEYGMDCAYKISYGLSAANAVIVSGMALGIDGVCAAGAIAAGGDTVAILGCGIDILYPKQHKDLRNEICKHGAVMSEYPPGTRALAHHFPERNRLIGGMTRATLVIEAGEQSGALITARNAFEAGRDVFALPGNVDRESAVGVNRLLDEGARPLLSVQDVLFNYRHTYLSISSDAFTVSARSAEETDRVFLEKLGVLRSARRSIANTSERKSRERVNFSEKPAKEGTERTVLSEELLSTLSPVQVQILRTLSERECVSTDELYALPFQFSEISSALTYLEVKGLVRRLSGSQIGLC